MFINPIDRAGELTNLCERRWIFEVISGPYPARVDRVDFAAACALVEDVSVNHRRTHVSIREKNLQEVPKNATNW